LCAELFFDPRQQVDRQQGMTAQVEEVVVDSDN